MADPAHGAARALRTALASAALAVLALPAPVRAAVETHVSGSVYVDYWGITDIALFGEPKPGAGAIAARTPSGLTYEASLKIEVDVHEDVSFSAKACAGCHGIELQHIHVEYMPSPRFNVQAGRLTLPFGEYSNRIEQAGHRTVSAPLIYDMGRMAYGERSAMNLGVIPLPYVDNGVLIYGQFFIAGVIQTWYGLYAAGGFKGANDFDFTAMRALPYYDNNRQPAVGGRLAFTYASGAGALLGDSSVGGSFTAGRYDKAGELGYLVWGADATVRVWRLLVRGEYAERKTDLNPDAAGYRYQLVDPWFRKRGWYAELEHPLVSWLGMVYRYEELRRTGVPPPGAQAQLSVDSTIRRYTLGAMIVPVSAMFLKLNGEYCDATDFPAFLSFHAGVGGSF